MYGVTINNIYSFVCDTCNSKFDITIKESPEIGYGNISEIGYCPVCGSKKIRKDYKGEHVQLEFRGEGFYSTDNKK